MFCTRSEFFSSLLAHVARKLVMMISKNETWRRKMSCIKWLIVFFVLWILPANSFAAEELPGDGLVIQAKIPRKGKGFLGFGFDSLWMMNGKRLTRVNPADNSVIDIDVHGGGKYRAMAIGEGAVWVPAASKHMLLKVDPIANK